MHPPVGYLEISSRVPKKLETVVQASYDEFHVHFGSVDHHAHCRCHVREVCDCGHQELKLEEPGLCLGSATGFPVLGLLKWSSADAESRCRSRWRLSGEKCFWYCGSCHATSHILLSSFFMSCMSYHCSHVVDSPDVFKRSNVLNAVVFSSEEAT